MDTLTRRCFLGLATVAGLGALAAPAATPPPASTPLPALPPVPDEFPTQAPSLAREFVGVSHGNLARVNELLTLHPTLANAAWDWGFGDWETALGAASHMGNVEIATALLAHGARPSVFSAAMLGQLAVVRAFVEASPGVQGTPGPHGITLLAHAKAGGDAAKPVVAYLEAIGGADPSPKTVALPPELVPASPASTRSARATSIASKSRSKRAACASSARGPRPATSFTSEITPFTRRAPRWCASDSR